MSNDFRVIWQLTKVSMRGMGRRAVPLSSKRTKLQKAQAAGKKVGTGAAMAVLMLILGLIFGVMFIAIFFVTRDIYVEAGIGWLYFAIAGIIVFFFSLITAIFQAQATIFNAKDNELLLAMPIKPRYILTARILGMLVPEYLFECVVMIPALVIWLIGGYGTVATCVLWLLEFILLPLFAMSVASFIGWLVAAATARLKRRNIFSTIFTLAFFLAYMYFCFNMSGAIQKLFDNGEAIAASLRNVFPVYHFGAALANGSVVSFLIFALCALVPFILLTYLLSANFIKIVTTSRAAKKFEYRAGEMKAAPVGGALLRREFRRYFSNAGLILNMSIGAVMALLAAVVFVINRDTVLSMLLSPEFVELGLTINPAFIAIGILMFCSTTSAGAAGLVSLEGKTLWLLRSLPVRGRDVLLAKVRFHVVSAGIPLFLASVIMAVGLGGNALGTIALILTPTLYTLFEGYFGVALDLQRARFDWTNEVQAVKQGMSVFITMFGSWALIIALGVLYGLVLHPLLHIGFDAFLLVADAIILGVTVMIRGWLVNGGERKWNGIDS